ncbi:anhydro-N-acetylmuramic acid kinase [Streptomyces sp. NPDC001118]
MRRLLDRLLAEPYYAPAPLKTTGKGVFHAGYLRAAGLFDGCPPAGRAGHARPADGADDRGRGAVRGGHRGRRVRRGVRNPVLTRMLRERLAPVPARASDELGLPAAAKEAYAFAVLGFLTVHACPAPIRAARALAGRACWGRRPRAGTASVCRPLRCARRCGWWWRGSGRGRVHRRAGAPGHRPVTREESRRRNVRSGRSAADPLIPLSRSPHTVGA